MVISPLNYPGNKSKSLKEMDSILSFKTSHFIEPFCGSAIVSVNSLSENIICNDKNENTISLLKYLYVTKPEDVVKHVYESITKYNLTDSSNQPKGTYPIYRYEGYSQHNRSGYNSMKGDYNKTKDIKLLFPLIIYGFNHYLRFNKKNVFNVPVGKVDFHSKLQQKTLDFLKKFQEKKVQFFNLDYKDPTLYLYPKGIYYFDPPYLVTQAPYNSHWSDENEKELLDFLMKIHHQKFKFALSNVLFSNGKENKILLDWLGKNNFNVQKLTRQYKNSNYRKKNLSLAQEVLVTNF